MQRGQSTVEYAALVGLVAVLVVAVAALAGRGGAIDLHALVPHPRRHWQRTPDERALHDPRLTALIARAVPALVLERDVHGDDATVPVQADCRVHACAAFGHARPTLYVHVLRGRARTVVELWTYYPDCQGV